MSFLLWKWGGWWPSRKTWQCQLTAGRVNNYSQPSQLGSVAKQLPPQSYIICKRNTFFFFFKWNTGFPGGQGLFTWCFWSAVDLGEWNMSRNLRYLSSHPDQREWLHPKRNEFGERDQKVICAVLYSHGIPGKLWHRPVCLWILLRVLVASDLAEDLTKLRGGFG